MSNTNPHISIPLRIAFTIHPSSEYIWKIVKANVYIQIIPMMDTDRKNISNIFWYVPIRCNCLTALFSSNWDSKVYSIVRTVNKTPNIVVIVKLNESILEMTSEISPKNMSRMDSTKAAAKDKITSNCNFPFGLLSMITMNWIGCPLTSLPDRDQMARMGLYRSLSSKQDQIGFPQPLRFHRYQLSEKCAWSSGSQFSKSIV